MFIFQIKINNYLDSKQTWSEKRAEEIFSYFVPRRAEWDQEEQAFYLCFNDYGWNFYHAKKYLKRKDRRFWKKHSGFCGSSLRDYLNEKFELEGFKKEVADCDSNWTEICFKKI